MPEVDLHPIRASNPANFVSLLATVLLLSSACDAPVHPQGTAPFLTIDLAPIVDPNELDIIVADFSSAKGFKRANGEAGDDVYSEKTISLSPFDGVFFGPVFSATPGQTYSVTYEVHLPEAPVNFVIGPMFRNRAGKILSWGVIETAENGGKISRTNSMKAPLGSATVQFYFGGLWAPAEPFPTETITYVSGRLERSE